jgi:hypothetical protein
MPYVRIGEPTIYKGKALFKILCNLKDCGRGRIVYRTSDYHYHPEKVHFMRILHAQPLMDKETVEGNVVVERVFHNLRKLEPQVISSIVQKPDFRLCQWDKVRDYDPAVDAERRPRYMEMPPLLRKVMERSIRAKGERVKPEDLLLPAYKNYTGDHTLEDRVESNDLSRFLTDEFATHKDFDPALVPDSWNFDRASMKVGTKKWSGFKEGMGWEEHKAKDEAEAAYKAKLEMEKES